MKTLLFVIAVFCCSLLTAYDSTAFNQGNGYLQSDMVHDVFLYDTTVDNTSDAWRTNSSASWYLEPENPSDDFTGTEHSLKWLLSGTPQIDNSITFDATGIGILQSLSSEERWSLSGDFDIRIRYRDIALGANSEIFLEAALTGGRKISAGRYFDGATHSYTKRDSSVPAVYLPTAATDGLLRITRSSGTIAVWHGWWDTANIIWNWTQIGSSEYGVTADAEISIGTRVFGEVSSSIQAVADDFFCQCPNANYSYSLNPNRSDAPDFPAKALIMASELGIDILNADTNDMWMRFRAYDEDGEDDISIQNMVADKVTTVFALDGKIYCGAYEGNMQALAVIDFTSDTAWAYDAHSGNGTGWSQLGNIAGRNLHQGWTDMNQSYVQLKSGKVYDISVKNINGTTYAAIANGINPASNQGAVSVINTQTNTLSWDLVNTAKPVILCSIAPDNSLIYADLNLLAKNTSTYRNGGLFAPNYSLAISTVDDTEPAALLTTSQFVYVGEKALSSPYANGATLKYSLANLSYQNVVYKIGGSPTVPLWGSASCKALASDDHALWIGTSHPSYGRIYIMGIDGYQPNMLRGEFNAPYPLIDREITCLTYGISSSGNQTLYAGFSNAGVLKLSSSDTELSVNGVVNGTIQHNFNDRNPFEFKFNSQSVTLTPHTSGTLGTLEVSLVSSDPPSNHPEHTLDFWIHTETTDAFAAMPLRMRTLFTYPEPDGNANLHIWRMNTEELYWMLDDEDSATTVLDLDFDVYPGVIDFRTSTLGSWAFNDGDGGMLSFPPQTPEYLLIDLAEGIAHLQWEPVDTDTGGYPITDLIYREVWMSNDNSTWWDGSAAGVFGFHEWFSPATAQKRFYRIKLERKEPISLP